jgi:hypothetical protein
MSPPRVLRTSTRYFRIFDFNKIRPTLQHHAARSPTHTFRPRTTSWKSSAAIKSSTPATALVGLAGILIGTIELNRPRRQASHIEDDTAIQEDWLARNSYHLEDAFIYPQLSEKEKTRLIILEPGKPDDDLKCHLKPVDVLQDYEYEALSYTWGEELEEYFIECSGSKINLTANLDAALRQLRYTDNARVIWVDAICIDQNNETEKSRQVGIMQEIYANAKQVVVWLGPGAEEDARAFGCLKRLLTQLDGAYASRFLAGLGWYRDKVGKYSQEERIGPCSLTWSISN